MDSDEISEENRKKLRHPSSPHHGDVEGPQVGELRDLAGEVVRPAQRGRDALGARGVLHVLEALRPGGGAHQPEEDQSRRHQEVLENQYEKEPRRPLVPGGGGGGRPGVAAGGGGVGGATHKDWPEVGVLVDVHVAQIHQQGQYAVEEADGGHAHEELRRGGGVSHQVRRRHGAIADGGVPRDERDVGEPEERGANADCERSIKKKKGRSRARRPGPRLPERVAEDGVERLVPAVAAQRRHHVGPAEAAAAPEGEDGGDLREGSVERLWNQGKGSS